MDLEKKAQALWSRSNCIVNLNFLLFCRKSSNLSKMHSEFLLMVSKYSLAVSIFDVPLLIMCINLISNISALLGQNYSGAGR